MEVVSTVIPENKTPLKRTRLKHNSANRAYNFFFKKYFHSYLYVGNSENLGLEYNFNQSLEMRYCRV